MHIIINNTQYLYKMIMQKQYNDKDANTFINFHS